MTSNADEGARKHGHQSELIDEFDLLLGRSIRTFQGLEQTIEHRLLQLAAASSKPRGEVVELLRIAIAEAPFRTKRRLLEMQISYLPSRPEYKKCCELQKTKVALELEMEHANSEIKRIGDIESDRNKFVHSHWFVLSQPKDSTDIIPVLRSKTKAHPKNPSHALEEFSVKNFRDFLSDVENVDKKLSQATGRLLGLLGYDEDRKIPKA
ncbi:hypothetical protein [Undibacterium sp. WLX3042]|uniref:hypothetical protein n=1 Tax=Undibacterium sp. WLX3042 TaxID=3412686 RepID=UPI003C2DED08